MASRCTFLEELTGDGHDTGLPDKPSRFRLGAPQPAAEVLAEQVGLARERARLNSDVAPRETFAKALNSLAEVQHESKRLGVALATANELVEARTRLVEDFGETGGREQQIAFALRLRGSIEHDLHDYEAAVEDSRRALEILKRHPLTAVSQARSDWYLAQELIRLADCHGHINQFAEGVAALEEAIELTSRHADSEEDSLRNRLTVMRAAIFLIGLCDRGGRRLDSDRRKASQVVNRTFPTLALDLYRAGRIDEVRDHAHGIKTYKRRRFRRIPTDVLVAALRGLGLAWRVYRRRVAHADPHPETCLTRSPPRSPTPTVHR